VLILREEAERRPRAPPLMLGARAQPFEHVRARFLCMKYDHGFH
jgi:hypothetical protein